MPRLAGPPHGAIETPAIVARLAGPDPAVPVWVNELGGVTFEVGRDPDRRFVKWAPTRTGLDLAAEAERLRWVVAHTRAPEVIDVGEDRTGAWLVTAALPGRSAVDPLWTRHPGTAVAAIGSGLRHLHDRAPVADCPYSWSAEDRLRSVDRRIATGAVDPGAWHPVHQDHSIAEVRRFLASPPPADRIVVCHGDACAPNTLLDDTGAWSGQVDFGRLGVGDRWADLAVATWSTEWNYGPGWEDALLDAYGIAPDPERTRYYRLLWDLG